MMSHWSDTVQSDSELCDPKPQFGVCFLVPVQASANLSLSKETLRQSLECKMATNKWAQEYCLFENGSHTGKRLNCDTITTRAQWILKQSRRQRVTTLWCLIK